MSTDSISRSRDISVLQLLTRLVVETERLIRLADDINQHATTPQAKAALTLIGTEVSTMLGGIKTSIDPLYNFYEIDPGLKAAKTQAGADHPSVEDPNTAEYDENALWTDVKKQTP
jgi:hypothetical protein